MRKFIIACIALAAACDSPTVPERFLRDVYEFRLLTPEPVVLRWPVGSTVKVIFIPDTDAARNEFLNKAIDHGIQVWNEAALYGEVTLVRTSSLSDADVAVMYSQSASPIVLSECPPGGGLAYTTFCATSDLQRLREFPLVGGGTSRVKFVVTVRTTTTADEATVRRLVTHEFGHVLGIAQHSPKQTDLMFGGTLNEDRPSRSDLATLQVLYHTAADIVP